MTLPRLCLLIGFLQVVGCSKTPAGDFAIVQLTPAHDVSRFNDQLRALVAYDLQLRRYAGSADDSKWQVLQADGSQGEFCVAWRTVLSKHGEACTVLVAGYHNRLFSVDNCLSSIDSVRLLWSARTDTFLLVVDSYGPTHSASASTALLVYEVDPERAGADELLVIRGPEEYLPLRTFACSVVVGDGVAIEASVSVSDSEDPKQGVSIVRAARDRVVILKNSMQLIRVRIAEL